MANQTVYPYGTEGSLPSSIGLVDDFFTGGVDKALTAEAGKNLYASMHTITDADTSSLTEKPAFIKMDGTNQWVVNYQSYACKFLPVLPGQQIYVKANSTRGTYVSILTSDQYASGAVASYATGESMHTIPTGGSYQMTVPSDGAVLYFATYTTADTTPSSIKVITDSGGSADLDEIMPYDMDLDSFDSIHTYPAATNKWVTDSDTYLYYGKFIPCKAGQSFVLTAINDQAPVRYTFLRSSDHVGGTSVNYASGYSGAPASTANGGGTVTAPGGAKYLYIVVSWDGLATYVGPSNIRTTGNTVEEIATAVVKEYYSDADGIPSGLDTYDYEGGSIHFNGGGHKVAYNIVSTVTNQSFQGGACYGDYLFMFTDNNTTCWVYNLATKSLLDTITIADPGFVSNCHCNTVNFGSEYYDANDPFPLIYVSTGYASGGYTGAIVYRIVVTTENETTSYSLSLVQTLKIPADNGISWTEFVTAGDTCFICFASTFYRMRMPKLSQGDIIFDLSDALEVYRFTPQPASLNESRGQGRFYHGGKIYALSGVPSVPKTALSERSVLMVFDLNSRTRETIIDLQDLGLNKEPETPFIWRGHLCAVFRSLSSVYMFYFD